MKVRFNLFLTFSVVKINTAFHMGMYIFTFTEDVFSLCHFPFL